MILPYLGWASLEIYSKNSITRSAMNLLKNS